jgi:hypothetical protein
VIGAETGPFPKVVLGPWLAAYDFLCLWSLESEVKERILSKFLLGLLLYLLYWTVVPQLSRFYLFRIPLIVPSIAFLLLLPLRLVEGLHSLDELLYRGEVLLIECLGKGKVNDNTFESGVAIEFLGLLPLVALGRLGCLDDLIEDADL